MSRGSMYEQIAGLSLSIDSVELIRREREVTDEFTRVTTIVELNGSEATGRGEDVTYTTAAHDRFQDTSFDHSFDKVETFDGFSAAIDTMDLFPQEEPEQAIFRNYRRWAFESAALDLSLRQQDTNLAEVLYRTYDPVRFVFSTRLSDPASGDDVFEWLERVPDLEFKLDPTTDWSDRAMSRLATTDAVRTLDLKGQYHGTSVDQPADVQLYERVLEQFPAAIIEDPDLTDETRGLFDGQRSRVAWDYPIRNVETIEDLPWQPTWLNIKPSRFGSVEALLESIQFCLDNGISMYGGGQFELGIGREHLHAFASLFHPTAPNDVAPQAYNQTPLPDKLPSSPLEPPDDPHGLSWSNE